ncbi:MAG: hypothetical protein WC264_00350 [Candidatus Paceibacterota bacterium]|jgi:hypothetical protein
MNIELNKNNSTGSERFNVNNLKGADDATFEKERARIALECGVDVNLVKNVNGKWEVGNFNLTPDQYKSTHEKDEKNPYNN